MKTHEDRQVVNANKHTKEEEESHSTSTSLSSMSKILIWEEFGLASEVIFI
jgi:hypothetical protein